jgi:uncharacterized protein (DUF58 family)
MNAGHCKFPRSINGYQRLSASEWDPPVLHQATGWGAVSALVFFLAEELDSGILGFVEQKRPAVTIQLKKRWILGLIAIPFLLQMIVPHRAWVAILIGIGGAWAIGYVWANQLAQKITIVREQRYGWVHVGDVLEEWFTLDNRALFPAIWIEVDDRSDLPGYTACSVRSAGGQQTIRWHTTGICRQRGLFTLGPWRASTGDPFGFFQVVLDFSESQSILIYPPVIHLPSIQLPRGAATGSGRTNQRALQVTTNAAGVRPFSPGDSINRVHWHSTAHRDTLMVKTFDLEPSGDLWIVLDMDAAVQAGEGEESTEEYGVILASSLADRMLHQNRAVGLVAYGAIRTPDAPQPRPLPTIVQPQKGQAQQWRILQALATVRAGGNWPLARVLAEMDRNLGRGMTLAVITPSNDPSWVAGLLPPMRRGVAPTVLLLDASSFTADREPEKERERRQALVSLLAELGVPSQPIAKGMPFEPIVEHKRSGPAEFRILPGFGRVIPVDR